MFWHVYFFSPPVRHAVLFGHVLACLCLQLHLSGMCCSLDMFWHVYVFSPPVRHARLFEQFLACLFLQPHLSGMCSSLDMFRHVYFFSCTCQVCAALRTCFGMFISSAALVRYAALAMFRHVYFFSCTCQVCAAFWTCFGMFISSAAPVRYVLLFRHVLACLFLQLHLSGMCSSLDMFWHVYFSSRTCQACTAFDTCFGTFISSLELARHVVPAEHVCFVLDNYWIGWHVCNCLFTHWWHYCLQHIVCNAYCTVTLLVVFSHLCCQVALTQRWNNLSVTNWKKKRAARDPLSDFIVNCWWVALT